MMKGQRGAVDMGFVRRLERTSAMSRAINIVPGKIEAVASLHRMSVERE